MGTSKTSSATDAPRAYLGCATRSHLPRTRVARDAWCEVGFMTGPTCKSPLSTNWITITISIVIGRSELVPKHFSLCFQRPW